ncbi:hypothetical protein BPT24_057 [Tenacibaculum phage pT24]|uniref:Uncharacterized protein n=1 Tax=Tenacibaculum phage pT24 TaxID=1880590 RepID=A0A1B4XWI7_9CAUD|nr:hypothetical protein HYP10_gp057 [Tenacibaculum phage pT24]BAV39180.1 hypothetical protein BPT24_057 [Tenacibaculum phage pT24]
MVNISEYLEEKINEQETIINERYVNLTSKEQMRENIDVIWDILQRTYAPIGGFLTAKTKEDLINKTDFIKMVRREGRIVAVALYKDKKGRKAIAKGSDGTDLGKKGVKDIYMEDIKLGRAWGEFSGASAGYQIKKGAVPIPSKYAKDILGKEILSYNDDGFHYTREIGGEPHEKIILGNPKK